MAKVDIYEAFDQIKRVTIANAAGDIIKIDCTVSESISRTASVSTFPIEDGGNISDHVNNNPVAYSLSGIQSDHPTDLFSFIYSVQDRIANAPKKSKAAYDALVKAYLAKEKLTINTLLETFQNMMITNFDVPRDTTTAYALKWSMSFQQVEFVKTTGEIKIPKPEVEAKATPKADSGKKPPKPVDAASKTGQKAKRDATSLRTLYNKTTKKGG